MRQTAAWLVAAGFLLTWAPACRSGATGGSENIDVALLSESASIQPGRPFRIGLHMKMKDGWHTYWKHPGDAGLPLRIEWTLPPGFTAGPIEWPAPEPIPTGDLMSYGYGHEVLLAVTITPPARVATDSARIGGAFDWLECKEACLAGSAQLDVTLPVRPEPPPRGRSAPLFDRARARLPRMPEGWVLTATAGPRAIELRFQPPSGIRPSGGTFFVEEPLVVEHGAAQGFEPSAGGYRLTLVPAANAANPPQRLTGVLVLNGVDRRKGSAVAVNVVAAPGDPSPAPPQSPKRNWPPVPLYATLVALVGIVVVVALRRRAARP
ncbi:MAG TPA: protein-disulfide reductase DsbD domain-containing protein [Candidatus Eisenbacteria bacterium]|nr:protein-disulfide reductase DsbD domain-containing protein [Candidatus Eisenbacteria bacterium]